MIFALPSSPHWAPTTTVTGISRTVLSRTAATGAVDDGDAPPAVGRHVGGRARPRCAPAGSTRSSTRAAGVDRRADRGRPRARRRRGVRRAGAPRRDRRSSPTGCASPTTRSTQAAVDPAVDAAIDDAIAHLRAFNEQQLARTADWSFESEPGLTVGEKVTPIVVGRTVHAVGQGQLPERHVPTGRSGDRRRRAADRRSSCRRCRVVRGEVDPAVLVVCRKLGLRDVFRVNGPAGIAALGFGTESIPKVRKVVGPGSPAVTHRPGRDAAPRRRDDDAARTHREPRDRRRHRRPGPARGRPADRGRARHRLVGRARHHIDRARRRAPTPSSTAQLADAARRTRHGRPRGARRATAAACSSASLDEAVAIANRYAPEHLQVAVDDGRRRPRRRRARRTPARS